MFRKKGFHMLKLTEKQEKVLQYIKTYLFEKGYPPSVRELGAALGLSSPSTVHSHLKALENKGYLVRQEGKSRAMQLTSLGKKTNRKQKSPNV